MKRTFVIGDVHGHIDSLEALLIKAGFVSPSGVDLPSQWQESGLPYEWGEVVQLGDLGHYGTETREGDLAVWQLAAKYPWFHVLIGNHEMALLSPAHRFRGQADPLPDLFYLVAKKNPQYAMERHGYLLTHAGLHEEFMTPGGPNMSMNILAALLQDMCTTPEPVMVRDAIARHRGGLQRAGGILWRDDREELADIPQIFGHSRGMVRQYGKSLCIDTASEHNGSLVGVWLPERKLVAVGPDAEMHEMPLLEG